jgi:ATP-dependent helicase Lhr and Lhr-like helicase
MPLHAFHPAVAAWFARAFPAPTPPQLAAWDAIRAGTHALVAAPTGSGKTLAAFLHAIDELVRAGIAGELADATSVLYVSPLKALSNDVRINLETPVAGIREELARLALPDVEIRAMVRSGDTPQSERSAMRKRAPHIVVTTPESLYVLLGSESGRRMLADVRSVIVDEIHALAPNKRGSHLALSIERLEALCGRRLQRIGLSATQKPIGEVARFLVGAGNLREDGSADCAIVDVGHVRERDLALELPKSPLAPVMSHEVWEQVYARLADLARAHRTTLVFVNTRRMAERAARHLSELLGREVVAAHHGSMAREHRLEAEQKLKRGELRLLVATASLELGIDIGDVELVCQLGSPRAISAFLQRVGRAGHQVGGRSKGRLFPLSRDELVECTALLDAVRRGELDTLRIPPAPLDVLAQQIVAEVAAQEWNESELFERMRRAWPYAQLTRERYAEVVRMLANDFTTRRGPRGAWLHRDAVNGALRARRGARMTALTSGGAIPDMADYQVVLEPQGQVIGSVNEDFAVESLAGDVFQLGNASYRILRVEQGRVRVADAEGQPPSIPFWLGEAPGRSDALSLAVSRLREEISSRIAQGHERAKRWLHDEVAIDEESARQLVDYLATACAALGTMPTLEHLAMERFFDESGGTQLVIHTPYGSRVNRAWGLALRKRFCRSFNFELQAAATEDAIVLSLSTSHSFPLDEVWRYLHSNSVTDVLTQALLDAPMFGVRWRWVATNALALPRFAGGRKVAAPLQRMRSEDLLATVFPDQVACQENIVGEREIPPHPLVDQTLHDCLHEAMDLDGLVALLQRMERGEVRTTSRDLASPSPLAAEVLNARPYAYLDDAPLEERRTQAVMSRRWVDPQDADDFGRLDPDAIAAVREQAWPQARDADELADALATAGFVAASEADAEPGWHAMFAALVASGRAVRSDPPAAWLATERLPAWWALHPEALTSPPVRVPEEFAAITWSREDALRELLRARLAALGPVTVDGLSASFAVSAAEIEFALLALEREGYVMRGRFTPEAEHEEWCERHLLARIHRYTVGRLRREIEPVEPRDLLRFLAQWQQLTPATQATGPAGLASVLEQLEGFEAPAAAWENEILPARVAGYDSAWLDELCLAGRVVWARVRRGASTREHAAGPVRATPIVLLPRRQLASWTALADAAPGEANALSSRAQKVADVLQQRGASFFDELLDTSRLLRPELEDALSELVAAGRINSDSFAGLRALLTPASKRDAIARRGRRQPLWSAIDGAGRWSLLRHDERASAVRDEATTEHVARTLLRRYGMVCWRLLDREAAWLPPWRDLLRVYRRLEARGEIRGGRFVAGLAGEHFALPEAVALLRRTRQSALDGSELCVSGADPLNLVGGVLPGERVPALAGARVLYRDGTPQAALIAGEVQPRAALDPVQLWSAKQSLQRDTRHASRQRALEAVPRASA